MSSILRPTPAQKTRRLVVLATAAFAVVVAYGQMGLGLGQTAAEFSADSDATLKVAGWAFSIWGIIYLGLLAYAVRQVLPQTGESPLIEFDFDGEGDPQAEVKRMCETLLANTVIESYRIEIG